LQECDLWDTTKVPEDTTGIFLRIFDNILNGISQNLPVVQVIYPPKWISRHFDATKTLQESASQNFIGFHVFLRQSQNTFQQHLQSLNIFFTDLTRSRKCMKQLL
jgi:hypothetical protein